MLRELLQTGFWQAQLATPGAELLLKVTLLLMAALAMSLLLRGAAAGVRHLLWATTICALLLLPLLSAASPWRLAVLPASATIQEQARSEAVEEHARTAAAAATPGAATDPESRTEAAAARTADGTTPSPASSSPAPALVLLLVLAWAIVTLALLGRLLTGWLIVRRIARRGEELTSPDWTTPLWEAADRLDMADAPRLVRSDRAAMPFACGVRRPMIVLPPESDEWSEERRRAVLLHELAHVRRKDLLAHMLGRVACAVYWAHPLVWSAARRLRAESERACDDLVLGTGTRASEYADHLLQIVTAARHSRAPAVALPMAQRREFEGRMLAILDPRGRRRLPRVQAAVVASGVLLVAVLLAASAPASQSAHADAPMFAGYDSDQGYPDQKTRQDVESTAPADTPATRSIDFPHTGERAVESPLSTTSRRSGDTPEQELEDSIAEWATEVAESTVGATFDVLRSIGIPVPADARSQSTQDTAQRARETALLISALSTHGDTNVRRTAAWGLAVDRRRESGVADALRRALLNDASAQVREMAAWGLAHRMDSPHTDALATVVGRDASAKVRETAAWGLGHMRAWEHADALLPALSHEDADTRMAAAWALGRMRARSAPAQLIALVNDASPRVQQAAAWALTEIRDPAAMPALMQALESGPSGRSRDAIVRAILLMGSSQDRERLLSSPHADVQERAIRSIASSREEFWPWPWPWPRPRPFP